MLTSTLTGFAASFSLILAIGAQNAFVLRQGLKQEHVFWLVLFCAISDALLITAGVLGFGLVVAQWPWLPRSMAIAGAGFLIVYGLSRFWAAWRGRYSMELSGQSQSLGATIAIAAAFTWANPHVYLDTMGILGAISTSFHGQEKLAYTLGAISASFVFFFSLGYGAKFLAPVMQTARAWRVLDVFIGFVMWWLAYNLVTAM